MSVDCSIGALFLRYLKYSECRDDAILKLAKHIGGDTYNEEFLAYVTKQVNEKYLATDINVPT